MSSLSNGPLHSERSAMKSATVPTSRHIKKWEPAIVFILILTAFVFGGPADTANAKELAIIADKTFPVDTITLSTLQEIYLGKKEIIGDVRLKPVDQRDNQ